MISLSINDMWNFFESLASYQWQCECASDYFACSSPPLYDLRAQSPCVDQFRDGCDHHSSYPLDVCSYCQSFDHNQLKIWLKTLLSILIKHVASVRENSNLDI